MQYRRLGRSGLKVSAVSLGGWLTFGNTVDVPVTRAIVKRAIDLGVTSIDTADVYAQGACESALGETLRGIVRKDLVIGTKVYWPTGDGPNDRGLSRKHICESLHASLRRLGTDYVDLYYCHRFDGETPVEETALAMDDLVQQGKVLYWGVSCWTPEQMAAAHAVPGLRHRPVVDQPAYSLLDRRIEADVLPACARLGMGVVSFSPLGEGVLSGKYLAGTPADSRAANPRANRFIGRYLAAPVQPLVQGFVQIAQQAGVPPAELAIAWCLRRPELSSVILGASRPEQLDVTVKAVDRVLSPDVLTALDRLVKDAPQAD